MRLRKFFAKLFVIFSTFFIVLSPIVLVEEAGHDCTHEDCQICEVIRTAEENFKTTRYAPAATAVILLIPIGFILALAIVAISKSIDSNTLVSLKTKLSN